MSQPAGDNACDVQRLPGPPGLRHDSAGPGLFLVNTPTLATVPDSGHAGRAPIGSYRTALGFAAYLGAGQKGAPA